ncbi:hypothetical protein RUM44_013674 [Polyplax serrata]|uniref:Uncharacterized protein n=1 Tax=Polyplax serrata TaxID=468196 RepID=A0ABR1BEU1_POLSC
MKTNGLDLGCVRACVLDHYLPHLPTSPKSVINGNLTRKLSPGQRRITRAARRKKATLGKTRHFSSVCGHAFSPFPCRYETWEGQGFKELKMQGNLQKRRLDEVGEQVAPGQDYLSKSPEILVVVPTADRNVVLTSPELRSLNRDEEAGCCKGKKISFKSTKFRVARRREKDPNGTCPLFVEDNWSKKGQEKFGTSAAR